ncbi:MAG: beta-lactamase family protein, partial [Acidobacteria bacterium]|nr:beta-lactamase family protein [Acidobacteriota bacterium]
MALAAVLASMTFPTIPVNSRASTKKIDAVLEMAVEEKKIPGIVAMVAVGDRVTYQGAAGKREAARNVPITVDSIFRIASMVKPVTSVAVMQLVETGRVKLDEPAATYLPELSCVQVLEEFEPETGRVKLRPPHSPPTIRQLLSHTSGFAYQSFDPRLHAYLATIAGSNSGHADDLSLKTPLMFDPGTRWEYGISSDWLGKLIEKMSGETLAKYFGEHIFQPLAMNDTFYDVPRDKQARVVVAFKHEQDGGFREIPPQPFEPVRVYSGGGGLYSTAGDYLKFERMLLAGGELGGQRILKSQTVEEMSRNQIGQLTVVPL